MSPAKRKTMAAKENGKEFWVELGEKIGASTECAKNLTEKLEKFMTNDHVHLCEDVRGLEAKVDKLAIRIAYIVGGISALSFVIQVLVKVLGK